jgi:DNA-binding MarR family transcriptional regulator
MTSLIDRHADQIAGVLSCYDRVLIRGTPIGLGFPGAVGKLLKDRGIDTRDFPRWASRLTGLVRENAERIAQEHGLAIEFIRKKDFRKEDRIAEIRQRRGDHPGLVHVFGAMESCTTYRVAQHGKRTWLVKKRSKCLHYYFYFLDPELGLVFFRVATWAPFSIAVYFNGHSWLARQLTDRGIKHRRVDNAFVEIEQWDVAQKIADAFEVPRLHKTLDLFAKTFCPVLDELGLACHWGLQQVEYSCDLVFKRRADLADLYQPLIRHALLSVRAEDVAFILGRGMPKTGELISDVSKRHGFVRIKHRMEWASVKVYDKFGLVLRIETSTNDPSYFTHGRKVHQRDGQIRFKIAKVRRSIYSLDVLRQKLGAANGRYLEFLSTLELPLEGARRLKQLAEPVRQNDRPYRGFNLFAGPDLELFELLARGEFAINGFRNKDLRRHLAMKTAAASRCLRRFVVHDLIRKLPGTFKYFLTAEGRRAIVCALALKQSLLTPAFDGHDHEKIFASLAKI